MTIRTSVTLMSWAPQLLFTSRGLEMAKVGDSVRKAIEDWEKGEAEFAMLHACNAVDGTARKLRPDLGSNARFTGFVRDNYSLFGPMGAPGIDLVKTRWPVKVPYPKAAGGLPDIADVIYGIHRCTHGHGAELPDGFDLIADAAGPAQITNMEIEAGKVHLSDRVIFGLLAIAVLSPANIGQSVPVGYHLSFAGTAFPINEWWGRAEDFRAVLAQVSLPSVTLDFGDWMVGYLNGV
ncbi:MAG: hypothetical protein PSV26_16840 [Polaromonas sp.]|uniref:hypothetical protein n=1 Tax=Polaromonas sp. TaxID=1869339 RepID=UPI002488817B|nr:hypothetical protein [Polaromonas sp.]MDI1239152.1 hypothetical protein [Polaromonas sp.]